MIDDPAAYLAARSGIDEATLAAYARAPSSQPTMYSAVPPSNELERIKQLPRRDADEAVAGLVATFTNMCRTPWGTQVLRDKQALALLELYLYRGLLGPLVAGGGKTHLTWLAPLVLQSKRVLLLVPGGLEDETLDKFEGPKDTQGKRHGGINLHWMGTTPRIETYNFLCHKKQGQILSEVDGSVVQEDFLHRYKPDLIMLDEAQAAKSIDGAARSRLHRYWEDNPDCVYVALSATFAKVGLEDYAHIAQWCLRSRSPLPTQYKTLEDWCRGLDDKVNDRLRAGSLLELCDAGELELAKTDELRAARSGFRRRLVETPGVVASLDEKLEGVELTLEPLDPGVGSPVLAAHFETLRKLALTPAGDPVPDGKTEWAKAREMALDVSYHWDPPAPAFWRECRKETFQWVRGALSGNRQNIDTFGQLADAVRVGKVKDGGLLAEWARVEPMFVPNPVPMWLGTEALDHAAAWLANHTRGVCWVEHVFFAQRLSEITGCPYFGEGGRDKTGRFILDYKGPCIASIGANHRGRNMQFNWDETLIMEFPQSPVIAEQMLARVHRPYQAAKVVRNWVWIGCYELAAGVDLALIGADATAEREGGAQRMLYAKRTLPTIQSVMARGGARWVK